MKTTFSLFFLIAFVATASFIFIPFHVQTANQVVDKGDCIECLFDEALALAKSRSTAPEICKYSFADVLTESSDSKYDVIVNLMLSHYLDNKKYLADVSQSQVIIAQESYDGDAKTGMTISLDYISEDRINLTLSYNKFNVLHYDVSLVEGLSYSMTERINRKKLLFRPSLNHAKSMIEHKPLSLFTENRTNIDFTKSEVTPCLASTIKQLEDAETDATVDPVHINGNGTWDNLYVHHAERNNERYAKNDFCSFKRKYKICSIDSDTHKYICPSGTVSIIAPCKTP